MRKGQKMSLEGRKKLSESCMGRVPWNKGLTKEDPRVFRNISGGSRKTQFKEGERPETKGEGNANWKGGRIEHNGYVYLRRPKHPYNKNNYVQEHRLVIEKHLKRLLLPSEIVHHKDGNRKNNCLDNLELMNLSKHTTIHNLKRWNNK